MKTSNKLLLGMYLFIITLIASGFVVIGKRLLHPKHKLEVKQLSLDFKFDSLFINAGSTSKIRITKGENQVIKYHYKSPKYLLKGNSLYIDDNISFDLELSDTLNFLSVFADKCTVTNLSQDSLKVVAIALNKFQIEDSKFSNIKIDATDSKIRFWDCEISQVNINLKDNSNFRSNNTIFKFIGFIDSSSYVNFSKMRNINLTSDNIH